jgi:hypothetical protein
MAILHLAMRAYCFNVAALHLGIAFDRCGRHVCGTSRGYMRAVNEADRSSDEREE